MNPVDMFRLRGTGWYSYDFGARRWSKRWSLSSLAVLFAEVPQPSSYLHRPHEAQVWSTGDERAIRGQASARPVLLAIGLYSLAPIHIGNPVPGLMETLVNAQSAAKGWR